jgi:MinD-like ATPase involved in chromosome partitioning or flagellar assembly
MIITVTSPKKGLGQTLTAINLAAVYNTQPGKKVLLIDINKYCRDVEYFLSDTNITKGLDEFIGLYNAGILNNESFNTCVKQVKRGIDIMAANDCLELDSKIVDSLLNYSSVKHDVTIIDSIGGNNSSSRMFFQHSDLILVVLNQSRNVVGMASQISMFKEFSKKIVFVLNKHMSSYEDKKLKYSLQDVESDLKNAGYDCPLYPLAYDMDIINEANDHSVLNIVYDKKALKTLYNKQFQELLQYVNGTGHKTHTATKVFSSINSRRNKLFGLI